MSSQGRRIIITQTQQSPLPTCNPNLMPFHIGYTGPAAVPMYLRVEKMKAEEEVKEQNEKKGVMGKDNEESQVKEAMVKEGEEVDEAKVAANDSTTKDENHVSNTNTNVEDEDVKMESDLLTPADPVQDQDSQLTDVEMTTSALPTLPLSSSSVSLSTIPSSSSSNLTLSGSIQSLASTSTLVSSESLNSSILTIPSSASSSSNLLPQISTSALKDLDKRFISSFRGRTIHGLTVDVPTGYTGLLLQGDPEPTADHVTCVEAKGEDEVDSGGRKTRSKGKGVNGKTKGKAKEKEKKAPPKGRLARTAAPRIVAEPEVITIVDNEDQEMTDPVPSNATEPATEVTNGDLEPTNDDTNAPDLADNDDPGVTKEIPLRKLIPQSTFSSITLWHADRAVDETRDEYYRTLTEWMALSHEIHRTDL